MNKATKVIAGSLGLTAFAIAVVSGLAAGNQSAEILIRALMSMMTCYVLGLVLGMIGEHTIEEHVREYVNARPAQGSSVSGAGVEGSLTTGGKLEENVSAG